MIDQNLRARNVIIHGLKQPKDNPTSWFQKFCQNYLEVWVNPDKVIFQKTAKKYWLCIATLQSKKDKAKIFKNCHKLKGLMLNISICDDLSMRERKEKSQKTNQFSASFFPQPTCTRKNIIKDPTLAQSAKPASSCKQQQNKFEYLRKYEDSVLPPSPTASYHTSISDAESKHDNGSSISTPCSERAQSELSEDSNYIVEEKIVTKMCQDWANKFSADKGATWLKTLTYILHMNNVWKTEEQPCSCKKIATLAQMNDQISKAIFGIPRTELAALLVELAKLKKNVTEKIKLSTCACTRHNIEDIILN